MDITHFTQEGRAEAMAKEREENSPEKGFTAKDYFRFGMAVGRYFCSCSPAEYEREWSDLLLDLVVGVLTLTNSTADFRVLRDSLPEGQLKRRADIALKHSDLEEAFRYARTTDRRLARAVLESTFGKEEVERRIQERQARDPLSPDD